MIVGYGAIVGLTRSLQRLKTSNPPTPKASAWQAPTCRAGAKAKEERPTPNAEVGMRLRQAPLQPRVLRG